MPPSHGLVNLYQKTTKDTSYKLYSPTATEKGEKDFMDKVNACILRSGSLTGVTVRIGGVDYKNIFGVNKIFGTPKADMALVQVFRKKLRNVCFMSHKMGRGARDFGQWGGMTPKAGTVISNDREVKAFIDFVKNYTTECVEWSKVSGFTLIKEIKSMALKKRAIYGPDFGGPLGENNVTVVIQGSPHCVITGSKTPILTITANHINPNGQTPTGEFIPCLMAIKKGSHENIMNPDKERVRSDFGIRGMRFSIYPCGGRGHTHNMDEMTAM